MSWRKLKWTGKSDTWWILDADFGVVLEHDINFLQQDTNIIVEKYVNAGYDLKTAKMIAGFYGKEGNYVQSNIGICRVEERSLQMEMVFALGTINALDLLFWMGMVKRTPFDC